MATGNWFSTAAVLACVSWPIRRDRVFRRIKWNSQKCNLCFFCECIWVKPSCKSMITTIEALLRFTIFSFSGQTHFQWECLGQLSDSIKIAIFETLRRLDTTWKFARSITRVSTHEHELNNSISDRGGMQCTGQYEKTDQFWALKHVHLF